MTSKDKFFSRGIGRGKKNSSKNCAQKKGYWSIEEQEASKNIRLRIFRLFQEISYTQDGVPPSSYKTLSS